MSVKLIEVVEKNVYKRSMADSLYAPSYPQWGKACRTTDPEVFIAQQFPVGCKDYIVDTQFRGQNGYNTKSWTKEKHRDPCIYVSNTTHHIENLIHNVVNFLNPWEIKMNLTPTQVHSLNNKDHLFNNKCPIAIVVADPKWNSNGLSFSMYLSIIRLCIHNMPMTEFHIIPNKGDRPCNEHSYINSLTKEKQDFVLNTFKNIENLLVTPPKGYNYTGYKPKTEVGHGMTGIFYIATTLANTNSAYATIEKAILDTHWLGNTFFEQLTGMSHKKYIAERLKTQQKELLKYQYAWYVYRYGDPEEQTT